MTNKDYTSLTAEELTSEAEKLKKQKTMTAVLIGFFVGVAVYSAVKGGFLVTGTMLIFAFLIASSYSQSVKQVQEEINRRSLNP